MTSLKKLFYGGRIYTMSDRPAVCDAMIVDGDRISWVGSASELSSVPSDSFELIDLDGQIILPGFIDSHTHLVFWALSRQRDRSGRSNVLRKRSQESFAISQASSPKSDKSWLVGKGWKREQWRKIRWPHKSELDRVVPDDRWRFSRRTSISSGSIPRRWRWPVSTGRPPDPEGGEIGRDETGEATGILRDKAYPYGSRPLKPPSQTRGRKGPEARFCRNVSTGMRWCLFIRQSPWFRGAAIAGHCRQTAGQSHLSFSADRATEETVLRMKTGFGSEFLRIGGIKIFADGALGSQTALMFKPFVDSKDNVGIEATSPDELRRIVGKATKAGMACAIHAIGDRANRNVLDAFEAVGRHVSSRFRHRIEHCQIVHPQDIKRFAELKVVASMQPSHATADIDLMKRYLGSRQKDSYRFRTFAKLGLTMCFGSDAPIEPLNPLQAYTPPLPERPVGGKICFNPRRKQSPLLRR